uniref:SET domain-containing protein n=1 Tax=Odontella aurita TaxID=265563 RepID=A0A7S4J730_9STRA|mmetsp:Transcript_40070/g.120790  ORF Transcript_40070/g.120790 Transcript_40070/m.120790 type:complete len:684 (+) Transcript_40070:238-2289(+)
MIVKPAVAAFLSCAGHGGRCGQAGFPLGGPGRPFLRSSGAGAALRFKVEGDLTREAPAAETLCDTDSDRFGKLMLEASRVSNPNDVGLSLKPSSGSARGIAADHGTIEGQSLLRLPLERCIVEDIVVGESDASTIPRHLRGVESSEARLAASLLLRLEKVRRHPSQESESIIMSMWADLLPKPEELRPTLPIHWPVVSSLSVQPSAEVKGSEFDSPLDTSDEIGDGDTADPGPGYSILSQAIELYGRPTVDRALNVYKTRSGSSEETGLPNERSVRKILYDKLGCSRHEVDAAVKSVVLTRGARRGGKKGHAIRPAMDDEEAFNPQYTALSRAINLYGRGTVDRALAIYGSRRGSEVESGLPDEHAVRSFLIRRFGCDREQVETVIDDVVRTRGARRGGSSFGIKPRAEEVCTSVGQNGKAMGCLSLERAAAKARAQREEDIRAVAEITQDYGSIGFTEDAVDFALDLVRTRAIRVRVPSDTGEGREVLTLSPIFDLLNHGGEESNAYYNVEGGELVVRSSRPIAAGEEILIDYGSEASLQWQCLLNYGFVSKGNRAELIVGEGDKAQTFLVESNRIPRGLVSSLSSSTGNPDSVQFTPELAEKVADLASATVANLDKLDFELSYGTVASSLLRDLRESQRRVLMALKDNILRHKGEVWQGWRSNELQRFTDDDGKEQCLFVL